MNKNIKIYADSPCDVAPVYNDSDKKVHFQWEVNNDNYRPSGKTCDRLPSGVYNFEYNNGIIIIKKMNIVADSLVNLPDSSMQRVLIGMDKFWKNEEKYREFGLLYKRGLLLYGKPGAGKTALIYQLMHILTNDDGIVVICDDPILTSEGLEIIRKIEPNRKIINIMEDIDEIIERYTEHTVLSLLDGENQVDNICHIATTNYPEKLGSRIINRPSRFDECIHIDMPSENSRRSYLMKVIHDDSITINQWVKDTENFSIAHLRELVAAVYCLEQPYKEVIARLRSMIESSSEDRLSTLPMLDDK